MLPKGSKRKNEEERDLWIEILRKRIEIMNQIDFNLFEHTKNEEEVENEEGSKGSGSPSVRRIVQFFEQRRTMLRSGLVLTEKIERTHVKNVSGTVFPSSPFSRIFPII